ncbi:MAG: NAD-dependent epimerase/dehydratase family protein [Candidatus Omnitrophica bacterium]|nr:NAD-dependent epimerase/dehydratase family protein [Candidatus Omnitrophota bacterium]
MTGFFNNKKVLVSGGAGFIGANLVKRLLRTGAIIRATIHKKEPVIISEKIEYIRCDLLRMEDCKKAVEGMDYVFMCAANTSGAAVIASTPLVHVTPNIIMNSQMLEAAYMAGVKKFIFISSNAAYPPSADRPVREEEMFDSDPYDIYFGVGWMKRFTEILCRLYAQKLKDPMPTIVVRPSNIYGPYDDFDFATSHMMAATIRKVVERHNPIRIWGTGDDIRDLIYIDDFIDGLLLAAEKLNTFDTVNIAQGKAYSLKEILKMALEIDGYQDAEIVFDRTKPSMIPVRLIDTEKAERILGFKPKTEITEGITKTISWYRRTYLNAG